MVDALPRTLSCTVITHSPTIAAALLDHAADVFLMRGGQLKHLRGGLRRGRRGGGQPDQRRPVLRGGNGVHSIAGLTTGDADEAAMKRTFAGRAAETYVLASNRSAQPSRYEVLPFDAVTGVISDTAESDPAMRALAEAGVPIIHADGRAR